MKRVYCNIGVGEERRCKILKYNKQMEQTDIFLINNAFEEATKKDTALKAMVNNKIPVFQKQNDLINQLCDIDSDDDIEDNSVINVVLIPNSSNSINSPLFLDQLIEPVEVIMENDSTTSISVPENVSFIIYC